MESSRTQFEVLGLESQVLGLSLGVEAKKFSKMPCSRPRTALFFNLLKMGQDHDLFSSSEISLKICDFLRKDCFFGEYMKFCRKFAFFIREDFFFFLENTSAFWPRPSLSLASSGCILGKSVLGLGFFLRL